MTRKRNTDPETIVSASGSTAVPARRKAAKARTKHVSTPGEAPVSDTESADLQPLVNETAVETPVAVASVAVTTYEPTYEEIATQAYLYWEARGCQGGSAEEDWLRAEQELRSRANVLA